MSSKIPDKITLQFFKEFARVGGEWEHHHPAGNEEQGEDRWTLFAGGAAASARPRTDDSAHAVKILDAFDRSVEYWK
eukprot:SAG31_NODE_763_length_12265_cov_3.024984_15_plen_77_part_00